jgi:hypothetical protein
MDQATFGRFGVIAIVVVILKAWLLWATVIAPFGCFDHGCEAPDKQYSKNDTRGGIQNEREKVSCRKDAKDQDTKGRIRRYLSERSPDSSSTPPCRQARLRKDWGSVWLDRVSLVVQHETYRRFAVHSRSHQPLGGLRRTPSPLSLESIHAIQRRRNPASQQSNCSFCCCAFQMTRLVPM